MCKYIINFYREIPSIHIYLNFIYRRQYFYKFHLFKLIILILCDIRCKFFFTRFSMISVNQLIELMNSALTVSEADSVLATQGTSAFTGCGAPGCPAPRVHARNLEPTIPVSALQPLCTNLSSQLSQFLVSI